MDFDRYYGPELRPFGNLNKPVQIINNKHLDWVRSLTCKATGHGNRSEAHHVQLKSSITNDLTVIPLLAEPHKFRHDHGVEAFENEYCVIEKDMLIATLIERVMFLEQIVKKGK